MRLRGGLTPAASALLAVLALAVAGITHAVSVLALPWHSVDDAFARVAAIVPAGGRGRLDTDGPSGLPFADPSMVTDACRYDLDAKPFRLALSPFVDGFVTIGFHARHGTAFYGLTVRASDATSLDLILDRKVAEPGSRPDADAHTVMVAAPEPDGFVTIATPRGGASERGATEERLGRSECRSDPAPGS